MSTERSLEPSAYDRLDYNRAFAREHWSASCPECSHVSDCFGSKESAFEALAAHMEDEHGW